MKFDSTKLVGSDMNLRLPSSEGSLPVSAPGMLSVHNNALYRAKAEWSTLPVKGFGDLGPGPRSLIGGSSEAGYFGLMQAEEFIHAQELLEFANLGNWPSKPHNPDSGWLKFVYKGKILFVSAKTLVYDITWWNLNSAGVVFGDKTISIGANTYAIRLFEGAAGDPALSTGREWNSLMWNVTRSPILEENRWADLPIEDVGLTGDGSHSWCQELYYGSTNSRFIRSVGTTDKATWTAYAAGTRQPSLGWRPVLELIQ